jgi:uncharacterized caspase-like protein
VKLARTPILAFALAFVGGAALAQSPSRNNPDYFCSFAENEYMPVCVEWLRNYQERMKAQREAETPAEDEEASGATGAATTETTTGAAPPVVTEEAPQVAPDRTQPVLQVTAPRQIDLAEGGFRIEGLVGDDGSPPTLTVNGNAHPLFEAAPGEASLGRFTSTVLVDLPVARAGDETILLRACDEAGNCVDRTVTVRVAAAAPAAPALTTAPTPAPAPPPPTVAAQRTQRAGTAAAAPPKASGDDQTEQMLQALLERLDARRAGTGSGDRDLPVLEVETPARTEVGETVRVTGLIGDEGSPPRLRLNGEPLPLFQLPAGGRRLARHTLSFEFEVDTVQAGERRYVLEACDADGNCFARKLSLQVALPNRPSARGRNFALIVGNDSYDNLSDLKTAAYDASTLAEVLRTRYVFEDDNVRLLINADRRAILGALSGLRDQLNAEDRLLIYYAGHGQIDPVTDEGFWLPTDARPGEDFTWIDNGDIRRYLKGMPARHVLVVADSCFSGSLTRAAGDAPPVDRDRFFAEMDSHVSRKVISSGGTEPVADAGTAGHSVFAYYLLKALRGNSQPYLTSFELFNGLVRAVTNNSSQKPEFGTIGEAGDEGSGDFTFMLKPGG